VDRLGSGVYYLVSEGPGGPEYALVPLEEGLFLLAFSSPEAAEAAAAEHGGEVGYFPDPRALPPGLPGVRGLFLDPDAEGEGLVVYWEDLP